jgi:hypothetical protein
MTTFLAVVGVNRRLSSLMQLLLPLFFITLMTCTLAFSGGVQSSQTGPVILPSLLINLFRTLHWFTWSTGRNFQHNIRLEYYRIVHHTTCIAAGLNIFILDRWSRACMYACIPYCRLQWHSGARSESQRTLDVWGDAAEWSSGYSFAAPAEKQVYISSTASWIQW